MTAAADILNIKNVIMKILMKTRGAGPETWPANRAMYSPRRNMAVVAFGATYSELKSPSPHATMPTIATMRTNWNTPKPQARIAVTSLSAASRLEPKKNARRAPPWGWSRANAFGRVKTMNCSDTERRSSVLYHQFQYLHQVGHEQDKREQDDPEQGVERTSPRM